MGSGTIPIQFVVLLFSVIFFCAVLCLCINRCINIVFLSMKNDGYFINNQLVI